VTTEVPDEAMLVSFDIDGTLETGDPAGPVPIAFVRLLQDLGWLVGSCSDRTHREQSEMWAAAGIVPDFVSVKNGLPGVREAAVFCGRHVHIGDTLVDAHFAAAAGFEFRSVLDLVTPADVSPAWIGAD
jgi:phosphoglycolate phosphatase-like HAD superfamily hydrolase